MSKESLLDISWATIVKISVAVLVFYLLYLTRDLLVWFVFALIISVLFNPAIDFLQKWRIPRAIGVLFLYLTIFGALSYSIYSFAPFFISEIQQFSQFFPEYFERLSPPLRGLGIDAFADIESFITAFGKTVEGMAGNLFSALFSIFGGIFSTLFVVTIAIFLSLEKKPVERTIAILFPQKYEEHAIEIWKRSQKKVSGWFGVRILGSIFVGAASLIAFLLFNVEYPYSLAFISGVLNFIPIVGPIIMGIIAFLIVALDSLLKALFILIFFVLIQQVEGNILTPVLTRRFIGLPPVLVLLALAAGGKLWGVMGAVLAIPLFGILFEFIRDFLKKKKETDTADL